ncbi:hypothetical protein LPJ66_003239 [Kickxella alabastrina]|uniref:Uncharacterized protein n=1 Tax=Kickxella alabastrina TaxID=61397 RepID=A0ACC1IP36_9FUNG|nr:hypothetical protein LPJ66_003239 [Kickxella alabastrina]
MTSGRRIATRILRIYWVVLLLIGEIGLYRWHISRCKWPIHEKLAKASPDFVHVAIVADPQIVDHYSYGQSGLLLRTVEFFTDIYIRKSYRFLQTIRNPSAVIFLGDLMDGGREWTDEVWHKEYDRYKNLFVNRSPQRMRTYDMAGNHDIGIGNTVVPHALERFHKYIGPTNQVLNIADHEIILLDTLTLENDNPQVSNSSRQLVQQLSEDRSGDKPRLLFTHVPMSRPDGTYCGFERQSKRNFLPNRRGYQFRDQLFANTTLRLLDAIQPNAVFSGDDHDSCTVEHQIPSSQNMTTEYTIGAFGWASGVPIASYALLTLYPRTSKVNAQFQVRRCFLPHQLGIYEVYIANFAMSLLVVAVLCYQGSHSYHPAALYSQINCGSSDAPECERHLVDFSSPSSESLSSPSLPLPVITPGKWSFSKRGFFAQFLSIMKDIICVVVPTYMLCLSYFYVC